MGAFVISPLPPFPPEELQAAGSLRSTGVTPLPRYYEPHRHPLVFDRLPGVSGYTAYLAAADFAAGRGGFLQLRDASCVTVLPLPPRRSDGSSQPGYGPSCCLRLSVAGSTSECPPFRGHIRVRLRYGPVTCCHPEDGLVDGLQRFGFPPPCHPSYKALAFTLAGLTPAERVRLRWTHNRTGGFTASGSPVGSCVSHTEHPGNRGQQGVGCGKGRNDTLSARGPLSIASKPCLRVHDKHFFVVNRCVTRSRCRFWRKIFPTTPQISFYEKKGWRSVFQTERRSHHALRIGSGTGKDRGSVHGGSALPHARPQPARW